MNDSKGEQITVGELTHRHLGRTIRLVVGPYITVEDEVAAIGHVAEVAPDTMVMFKNVTPDTMAPDSLMAMLSELHPKRGFFVNHDTAVVVL